MEIKSAVGMATGTEYRSPQPASKAVGEEGEPSEETQRRPLARSSLNSDSMMAVGRLKREEGPNKTSVAYLEGLYQNWRLGRNLALGLFWVSLILFLLFILQPLLVLLFSLGTCVVGGCDEWLEFSTTVGVVSLVPGGLALFAGIVATVAHMKARLTEQRLKNARIKEKSLLGIKLPGLIKA